MKNFVQPGNILDLTIPTGKNSGDGILIGDIFGVVTTDNNSGGNAVRSVAVEGVVELPKLAADAMTEGQKVNWNDSNSELQAATADKDGVATVVEDAGASTTTVKVKLTPL